MSYYDDDLETRNLKLRMYLIKTMAKEYSRPNVYFSDFSVSVHFQDNP